MEEGRKYDIQTHFDIYFTEKVEKDKWCWGKWLTILINKELDSCHSFYQNKFKMYFKIPGKIQINLYVILEWEFFLIHISIYAHMYMYTHTYIHV